MNGLNALWEYLETSGITDRETAWLIFRRLWNIPNLYARTAVRLIIGWPLILLGVALFGGQALIPYLALAPIIYLVVFLFNFRYPLTFVVIAIPKTGRNILKGTAVGLTLILVFLDIAWGLFLALVPVSKDLGLLPYFFLCSIGYGLLKITRKAATVRSLLFLGLIVITVIWLLGGRQEIGKWASGSAEARDQTTQEETDAMLAAREQAVLTAASENRNRSFIQNNKPVTQPTMIIASGNGQVTVAIDGTNEWSPSAPANWFHRTGLMIGPKQTVHVLCENPGLVLSFNNFGDGTTISGGPLNILGIREEEPRYGLDTFGGLYAVLLGSEGQEVANATFNQGLPYLNLTNPTDKEVQVVLHRNLKRKYMDATDGLIHENGYTYSGRTNQQGDDKWRITIKRVS